MAISPPSDIVLDVARAADPAGVEAARTALAGRAGQVAANAEAFSVRETGATASAGALDARTATPESYKRFEAMVLQTFIQNMLPKDAGAVYGKGMAGDMWKSLLAEKVADSLAERGGIGIADRVLGKHYTAADKPEAPGNLPRATEGAEPSAPSRISPAIIEDMLRRLNDTLVQDFSDSSPSTTDRG